MKRLDFLTLSLMLFLSGIDALAQSGTIRTYVGPALPVSGAPAITQTIGIPQSVAADGAGGYYVASSTHNKIYHVSSDGTLTVAAGNGISGYSGDGGPATTAQLNYVHGIEIDSAGNLFIADTHNNRIRKVDPSGVITTVAGTGAFGTGGDGGPATSAKLSAPRGVASDHAGNLFISDTGNDQIRKVTPAGNVSVVAGTGRRGFSGDGGPATAAQLGSPEAIAVDTAGNLFIVDRGNDRIRMVTPAGVIITVAGGVVGFAGDGGPAAAAQLSDPRGVTVDTLGNVFIADSGNNRIRMINRSGIITTIAGGRSGFGGDGDAALSALLALPVDISADAQGNVFIADRGNYRVRRINAAGVIMSVGGMSDDGGSALAAQLNHPNAIAVDGAGNVFIADTDSQRIRRVGTDGVITTVAGNGAVGFAGDGGPATLAELNYPAGVAVDAAGSVYIADTRNNRIRRVTPYGVITTVADQLNEPHGVTVDAQGRVFIADTNNQRVLRLDPDGVITPIAGNGTRGFSGDGGPAMQGQMAEPTGLAVDTGGNVYIADSSNNRIRMLTPQGVISTVAGNGTSAFGGDGGPANAAGVAYPNGVSVDGLGNLFIADTNNQRIRKVGPDGVISTIAGTGQFGFGGDGATSSPLASPYSVAVEATNAIVIADTFSQRVRKAVFLTNSFTISSSAGTTFATDGNSPSIQTGYGRIQPAGGVTTAAGLAIYSFHPGDYMVSETSVPGQLPLRSGRIYVEVDGPVNTGLAIANPNNQPATINFFYTDLQGNDVGFGVATIPANQQTARFLKEEPFKTFAGETFHGTLTFNADVPIGVVAIRGVLNERQDFLMSTLPVIDTTVAPNGMAVVPHFADGGGWKTQILLVNPTNGPVSGILEFRDNAGALTNVGIDGETNTTFNYETPPRSSQKLATTGAVDVTTVGSVRIIPANGGAVPVPQVIFSYKPGGAITTSDAGVPSTKGTSFRIYVESSGAGGQANSIQSGIAVTNNTSSPATVTFDLIDLDGPASSIRASVSTELPAFGHITAFAAELFPDLPNPFRGILRVSSSSVISAIGLRGRYNERADFLITTTPPISDTEPAGASEYILPHLVDGGGYTTQFVFLSGSPSQPASGSLILIQNAGQPFGVTVK